MIQLLIYFSLKTIMNLQYKNYKFSFTNNNNSLQYIQNVDSLKKSQIGNEKQVSILTPEKEILTFLYDDKENAIKVTIKKDIVTPEYSKTFSFIDNSTQVI